MRLLFFLLFFPIFLFSQSSSTPSVNTTLVYKIVEEMPAFANCGKIKVLSRSACFQEYLCKNLQYPAFAKKHGVVGEVIVSFIIDENGNVINAKIIQDIGASCGTAVLDFVNVMPNWKAGKQRGENVKVAYHLKVDFRLANDHCFNNK